MGIRLGAGRTGAIITPMGNRSCALAAYKGKFERADTFERLALHGHLTGIINHRRSGVCREKEGWGEEKVNEVSESKHNQILLIVI
jgi:hypothetical protein